MAPGFGLGPVFASECMTLPRRWQVFAWRALFVAAMLTGMGLLWTPASFTPTPREQLAELGKWLFLSLTTIQLTIVLLVAPAATAGAICVEKSRGTLYHVFVTDLTDREIVLGKLGARLLSLLTLLLCGVPVLAMAGLLGGIEYGAIVAAFLVTTGVAILSATVAMAFSVWVRKPHQALLPTYVILGLWLAICPAYAGMTNTDLPALMNPTTASPADGLIFMANPFLLAMSPYLPGVPSLSLIEPSLFLLGTILASSLLVAITILALRRVAVRQMDKPKKRPKSGVPGRILNLIPGPPLDGNPVLWREWHRKKPTKWIGRFWTLYAVVFLIASILALAGYYVAPGWNNSLGPFVNGWEVAIGLLLLMISATTSLAEERDRGSLDVIMTTPLPSRTILWGKWWGTFAMVPRLAIFPIWVCGGMAMVTGNYLDVLLLVGMILGLSAVVTSVGIAVATWVPRLGRAIATGVLLYAISSIGLLFVHHVLTLQPGSAGRFQTVVMTMPGPNGGRIATTRVMYIAPNQWNNPVNLDWMLLANPYYAVAETTSWAGRINYSMGSYGGNSNAGYRAGETTGRDMALLWICEFAASSFILMGLVLATFDRCLGRITVKTPNWNKRDAARLSKAY